MKISDEIDLSPNYQTGGWVVNYKGLIMPFSKLDEAVETVVELSLVIAIDDATEAKNIKDNAVTVKDAVEAFRSMIMTWFQSQIPDPHEVTDLNKIH